MPWKPKLVISLDREKHELQTKLLKASAELRLKSLAVERLELLIHQRNNRIDQLFGLLEQSRIANHKLERECEHLSQIIATAPARLFAPKNQTPHTPANQNNTPATHTLA